MSICSQCQVFRFGFLSCWKGCCITQILVLMMDTNVLWLTSELPCHFGGWGGGMHEEKEIPLKGSLDSYF